MEQRLVGKTNVLSGIAMELTTVRDLRQVKWENREDE
jgi:hypothetical protein